MSLHVIPACLTWLHWCKHIPEHHTNNTTHTSSIDDTLQIQARPKYKVKFCCIENPTDASQRVLIGRPQSSRFVVTPQVSRRVDMQETTPSSLGWDIILAPHSHMTVRVELNTATTTSIDQREEVLIKWMTKDTNNFRDVIAVYSQFTTFYVRMTACGNDITSHPDTFTPRSLKVPQIPALQWFLDILPGAGKVCRERNSSRRVEDEDNELGRPSQTLEDILDNTIADDIEQEMNCSDQGSEYDVTSIDNDSEDNDGIRVDTELNPVLVELEEPFWLNSNDSQSSPVSMNERAFYNRIINGSSSSSLSVYHTSVVKETYENVRTMSTPLTEERMAHSAHNVDTVFVVDGKQYDSEGKPIGNIP